MFNNQVALITGAARGLGLDVAQRMAHQGVKLVLSDIDGETLNDSVNNLKKAGVKVIGVKGNAAVVADIELMINTAIETFGQINILVNNAGGSAHTPLLLEKVTEEEFDRVMNWNVRSTFFCCKTALPHLRQSKGVIVNMASISGRSGWELLSPQYSAAKAAIIGMTRNLAKHLGPDGIRVNAVAPGFIKSGERAEKVWLSRNEQDVLKLVPLRERGEMEDISNAIIFLCSDSSKYITGAVLDVNGGFVTA